MKKILVIDDDERVLTTIRSFLEKREGYSVITALDGKAGIKAAEKDDPDLILLDIDMPRMNGLDVLKHLKAKQNTQYIPVIMLTGVDTPEAKDEANCEYAEQYIEKPCDLSVLCFRIERTLSLRATRGKEHGNSVARQYNKLMSQGVTPREGDDGERVVG